MTYIKPTFPWLLNKLSLTCCCSASFVQIRVNSINPTVVMTDMGKRVWGDPAKQAPVLARIPLGKFAGMHTICRAVL